MAVTTISGLEVEDTGIQDMRDLDAYVSNFRFLTFGNRGGISVLNMRGLYNLNQGDTSVSIYMDDVPFAELRSFDNVLYDLDRVEVLRGPQSTMFGKNSQGGVINIFSKTPGNSWEGRANVEGGLYEQYAVRAGLRGPLVQDRLFIDLAGMVDGHEGYIYNRFLETPDNDQHTKSGRVRLRWTPVDELDIMLTVSGDSFEDKGGHHITPVDKGRYRDWLALYHGLARTPTPNPDLGHWDNYQDTPGSNDTVSNLQALRLAYDAPWFKILSITSHRWRDNAYAMDGDFTDVNFMDMAVDWDLDKWTQELRVLSPENSGSLSWLVGGFFEHKTEHYKETYAYGREFPGIALGGLPADTRDVAVDAESQATTWAAFGQATYRLFDKRLGLTAGLRYEYVEQTMKRDHYLIMAGQVYSFAAGYPLVYGAPTRGTGPMKGQADFAQLLPKFVVDYRFTPEYMLYASVGKGYKPGGLYYRTDFPAKVHYDAETSWTYEAGLKTAWLDNHLQCNLAAFLIELHNRQDIVAIDYYNLLLENIGDARNMGVEAEFKFMPLEGLELAGHYGLLDARYVNYIDPVTGADYSGNNLTFTPQHSWGASLQYRFTCGVFVRGELAGYGEAYADQANREPLDGYTLLNAKIGYETEHFDIYLFGRNLTNAEYYLFSVNNMGTPGDPLTVGAGMTLRF